MDQQPLSATDLILNDDLSVYHLHVRDEHIADHVVVVGDQGRVEQISRRFDRIECKISNREFITHVGSLRGTRITVMSTGIGTDNLDIVMNELDAAVNIDPVSRTVNRVKRKLNIVRIGTSGALQEDIPVGSNVISAFGLGFDGLMHYYSYSKSEAETKLSEEIKTHLGLFPEHAELYVCEAGNDLFSRLNDGMVQGITATASGFYAPQGRALRLRPRNPEINERLGSFRFENWRITNFEMETSALYGLGNLLGHSCCTCCAIIANRVRKEYSKDHHRDVDQLIETVLERIT